MNSMLKDEKIKDFDDITDWLELKVNEIRESLRTIQATTDELELFVSAIRKRQSVQKDENEGGYNDISN